MPHKTISIPHESAMRIAESRARQAITFANQRTTIICAWCGTEFTVAPARASTAKYCTSKCYGRAVSEARLIDRVCAGCGTSFRIHAGQIKGNHKGTYCTRECWRNVQAERAIKRRTTMLDHAWRGYVMDRDGHACFTCGSTQSLHAHHIRPYATYPAGRFDPANGITLCVDCHRARHRVAN